MADFEKAIDKVLKLEGGYVDNPNDTGGATKYGISLRFLQQIQPSATKSIIQNLSLSDATQIYRHHFWDKCQLSHIKDQHIANKLFDLVVNMGHASGIKLVQKALNELRTERLAEDGIMGARTLGAINEADPITLLAHLKLAAIKRYAAIVQANRKQDVFLLGWLNRALA